MTREQELERENAKLREENAYLSFLVWKLSVRDLATQHPKYEHNLKRTFVSTRAADFGVDDVKTAAHPARQP